MRIPNYKKDDYNDLNMPNGDTDSSFRSVHSHLVKTRKEHKCMYCGTMIPKGDFCLSERGFMDNEPFLIHYCLDCVEEEMDVWNHKRDRDDAFNSWKKRALASGWVKTIN